MDPMTMMMLGNAVLGGVQSLMGGNAQAAQAAAQHQEFYNKEFARQLQVDAKNDQINQMNANKYVANITTAKSLGSQHGATQFVADMNYNNSMEQTARANARITAAQKSVLEARSISSSSGTAKAMRNLSTKNYLDNVKSGALQKKYSDQTLKQTMGNKLREIDGYFQKGVAFIPGINSAPDPGQILAASRTSAMIQFGTAALGVANEMGAFSPSTPTTTSTPAPQAPPTGIPPQFLP